MANSARHRPSGRRYNIPVRVEPLHVDSRHMEPDRAPYAEQVIEPRDPVAAPPHTFPVRSKEAAASEQEDWQDRALRLQAEMDNYRRRQRRIAQEQALADQERLLVDMLAVADNLDRTLEAATEPTPVRQGVALTRDELLRTLARYGVERMEAQGEPFDPNWHQAIDVVSAGALGVAPGTVVRVEQAGYRRGEKLLRPARVVVAQ